MTLGMDLYDVYQHRQIKRVQRQLGIEASSTDQRMRNTRDEIDRLHDRIDRLVLVNEAMWELLCECTGLTEEHLRHRMEGLDRSDGAVDGRRRPQAAVCECGAMVNARARICLFCSADAPARTAFDGL
jgi:hypothetical protein